MISLHLLAAVVAIQSTPIDASLPTSHIKVVGTGSVKTAPDVAIITYSIDGEGRTNDQALRDLVSRSERIENSLRSIDPQLDLQTEKVVVRAVRGAECNDERYSQAVLSKGACAVEGFVARQDFEARTSRVTDAGTLVGLAGRGGASAPEIEKFTLADDGDVRRQAIAAALADAQGKAQAIATAGRVGLGQVVSVSMEAGGERLIVVTGSRIRRSNFPASNPIAVKVDPEKVETSASVTVVYSIVR